MLWFWLMYMLGSVIALYLVRSGIHENEMGNQEVKEALPAILFLSWGMVLFILLARHSQDNNKE
ncbi:MAG: hypothetical protein ACXWB9_05305 [Flavisolibacter sp.]